MGDPKKLAVYVNSQDGKITPCFDFTSKELKIDSDWNGKGRHSISKIPHNDLAPLKFNEYERIMWELTEVIGDIRRVSDIDPSIGNIDPVLEAGFQHFQLSEEEKTSTDGLNLSYIFSSFYVAKFCRLYKYSIVNIARLDQDKYDKAGGLISGNVQISGELEVSQDVRLKSNTYIYKDLEVTGDEYITGNAHIDKHLTVEEGIHSESDLSVKTDAVISGDIIVIGDEEIQGDSHILSNSLVDGNSTVKGNKYISGILVVNDDINGKGDLNISGSEYISGNSEVSGNEEIKGNSIVRGTQRIYGKVNLEDELEINKAVKLNDTLSVTGKSFLQDDVEIYKDLLVHGIANFDKNVYNKMSQYIEQNLGVSGGLEVNDDATFNSSILVKNDSIINGNETIDGSLTVKNEAIIDILTVGQSISSPYAIISDLDSISGEFGEVRINNSLYVGNLAIDSIVEIDNTNKMITLPKNSAYNKAFGIIANTISEGNHNHRLVDLLNTSTDYMLTSGDCFVVSDTSGNISFMSTDNLLYDTDAATIEETLSGTIDNKWVTPAGLLEVAKREAIKYAIILG